MNDDEILKIIRKNKAPRYFNSDDAINNYYFRKNNKALKMPPKQIDKEPIRKCINIISLAGFTLYNTVHTLIGVLPINHPYKVTVLVIGIVTGFIVGMLLGTLLNFLMEIYIDSINDERDFY